MKYQNNNQQNENIEELVENMDLTDKTEMGEFAEQIHRARPSGSNVTAEESGAVVQCKIIFPVLGMKNNIADMFMEVAKSRGGWATEKVVQGAGGIQNQRSGGTFGGWIKDRLFTPK